MGQFSAHGHMVSWTYRGGDGPDTFIFLHGYSSHQLSWLDQLEHFRALGRCFTVDLPGHGFAEVPADYNRLTQEQLIDLEAGAVQAIAAWAPVTLIGHSTGGLAALGIAARLPEVVQRVVCVDAVGWGPLTGVLGVSHHLLHWRLLYPAFWALWKSPTLGIESMLNGISLFSHDRKSLRQMPSMHQMAQTLMPHYRSQDIHRFAVLLNMLEVSDIRPEVPKVQAPVLVQVGDHDPVVPVEQAHWLADHLPHAELQIFPDCGHIPHMEYPDRWAQQTLAWLAANPIEAETRYA